MKSVDEKEIVYAVSRIEQVSAQKLQDHSSNYKNPGLQAVVNGTLPNRFFSRSSSSDLQNSNLDAELRISSIMSH